VLPLAYQGRETHFPGVFFPGGRGPRRRRELAAQGPAERAQHRVHPAGHAGPVGRDGLDDQVAERREGEPPGGIQLL
jgi:hypothetical protein